MSKLVFKDRFSDFLSRRLSKDKKDTLFQGEFTSSSSSNNSNATHLILSPNSNTELICTPSSNKSNFSLNSSAFSYSQYSSSRERHVEGSTQRKRLKKLKELQENECAICLDQITNRCQLDCKHHYCRDCLLGWLANTNRCPYCRAEVTRYWFKGEQYTVEQREFQYEGEMEENLDWVCYNCDHTDDGDIVLICDRCEAHACHVQCDETLHGIAPPGDWYCHFCR